MSLDQFDEFPWPADPLPAEAPRPHSTPPIALALDSLSARQIESGAWHDDFLLLGSRLRPIFDGRMSVDEHLPAYLVSVDPAVSVRVTCPVDGDRADRIRIWCPIVDVTDGVAGLFEFALRENARLPLARLSYVDSRLLAEYELPFEAAGIPALRSAVAAVGYVAGRLRPELTLAYPRAS